MPKLITLCFAAIILSTSPLCAQSLEWTFGLDQQRGYRPERILDDSRVFSDSVSRRQAVEFPRQRREGIWRWWARERSRRLGGQDE
jgi:hypothetical protein